MRIFLSIIKVRKLWGWSAFSAIIAFLGCNISISCGIDAGRDSALNFENVIFVAQKDRRSGEFGKAIERLEIALSNIKEKFSGIEEAKIRMELGLLYWNTGQMDKAGNEYDRVSILAREIGYEEGSRISELSLTIYHDYLKGKENRANGKYTEAVRSFEKAIRIAKDIGSPNHELKCLRQLSLVFWETDELEKYSSLTIRALALGRKLNHKREEGLCLNNLGLYYWKKHDYKYALKYYQEAFRISGLIDDQEIKLSATSNIAVVYSDLGEKAKAFKYLIELSKIDEASSNEYGLAIDFANLGINWYQIDNPPIEIGPILLFSIA